MLLSNEQATKWQEEAIKFLKENEYEWVTFKIEDNCYWIFDRLPNPDSFDEFENSESQEQGHYLLEMTKHYQFILGEY